MTTLADDLMPGMEEMLRQMALDPFSSVIDVAKALKKAEDEGKPPPLSKTCPSASSAFAASSRLTGCVRKCGGAGRGRGARGKIEEGAHGAHEQAMLCGGCKGLLYCSKECRESLTR